MEPTVTAGRGESLTGKVSGRWTIGEEHRDGYSVYYRCTCTCKNIRTVSRSDLLQGNSKSCGCYRSEKLSLRFGKPETRGLPEKRVYSSMKTRCYNPNYHEFHLYGGRGIGLSDDWKECFEAFYRDMGPRPSSEHQIDRRDNSLGYSKENCYWATKEENARNKRNTVKVEFEGCERPLKEVAEMIGVDYHALFYRYQKGERGSKLFRPSMKVRSNLR